MIGSILLLLSMQFGGCGAESKDAVTTLIQASQRRIGLSDPILKEHRLRQVDVPKAMKFISANKDYTSYHLLLALRESFREAYNGLPPSTKASILCDAMSRLRSLNDWGVLHPDDSFDSESAKALLEVGKDALGSLVAMLDNREPAPLIGSERATWSNRYQYRRCDFAYRYAMLLLGEPPTFETDPAARDTLIATLKMKLTLTKGK